MSEQIQLKTQKPIVEVEHIWESLTAADLNDLCDATDAAIKHGGGFGWVDWPSREILEKYWQGVIVAPTRWLFVARLDGVICGTAQLILPPKNNEAQAHMVELTTNFVAPWARGHGLAKMLLEEVEKEALQKNYSVINLNVRDYMQDAISLYEGVGYVQFGLHPYAVKADGEIHESRFYYKVIDERSLKE